MTDLIESLLTRVNFRTRAFHRGTHCGNWKLNLEHSNKVLFHFVNEGRCIVDIPEPYTSIELNRGDLLLIPNPSNHIVRSANAQSSGVFLEDTTPENPCNLVCAFVEFDPHAKNPLFDALPAHVLVRANSHADSRWLENLIGMLFAEARTNATGSQTVIERLTDILLIHVIRAYISEYPGETGILAVYNDAPLRNVLELIHENPEKPWTIADFSSTANLSRSAFIDKFTRTLGVPPMTYLTSQRLEYAHQELRKGKRKIIDVALDCGYENESSFSKAFKREYDISPSTIVRGEFKM